MWLTLSALAGPPVLSQITHNNASYRVVEVGTDARVELVGQAPTDRDFGAVLEKGRDDGTLFAATNAGMYHPDRRPVGLHVEGGTQHAALVRNARGGNFGLLPNGVFTIDAAGPRVVATPAYAPEGEVHLATQSGPMLVIDGALHPAFRPRSTNLRIRSGVGVRPNGEIVLAISDDLVRFHDFATLFRDTLGCPNALYLDGTVSQLWTKGQPLPTRGHYSGVLTVTTPSRRE